MAKNIETRESEAISLYTKDSLGVVRRVGEFSSDGSGLILGSAGAEGIPGLEQYNIKLHRGGNGVLQLILANDTTPEGVLAPNSSLATVFLTASGFSNTDRSFFVIDSMSGAQTSQAGSVNSVKAYVDAEKHIGEVRAFAMSTPPANWMVCNGATLSKTIYPELYGVIDVTYGGTANDGYGNTKAGFKATTTIDRFDYDLKWNKLTESSGAVVSRDVNISVRLELAKAK